MKNSLNNFPTFCLLGLNIVNICWISLRVFSSILHIPVLIWASIGSVSLTSVIFIIEIHKSTDKSDWNKKKNRGYIRISRPSALMSLCACAEEIANIYIAYETGILCIKLQRNKFLSITFSLVPSSQHS